MKRRLTKRQQKLAEECICYVQPTIAVFIKRNPDLRPWARRVDLECVGMQAVCMAAFTFDFRKSKPTTYFSSAIRHALYREVLRQQKIDGRYIPTEQILDPQPNHHRTRQEMRAMRALRMLTAYDRTLLEDRLVEQLTLEQLSSEQGCDPRTIGKRVKKAIVKLRQVLGDLP